MMSGYADETGLKELENELMMESDEGFDVDLYNNNKKFIDVYFSTDNKSKVQIWIDTLKYVKGDDSRRMHDAFDTMEEKYGKERSCIHRLYHFVRNGFRYDALRFEEGDKEKADEIDQRMHDIMNKVLGEIIDYASEEGGFQDVRYFDEYIGRESHERGFPPFGLANRIKMFPKALIHKDTRKLLDDWHSNFLRYHLFSIKEYRDAVLLIRRREENSLVDVMGLYNIEIKPGNVTQSLGFKRYVDEKDIEYVMPNPSPRYGLSLKFISKRQLLATVGIIGASYLLGLSKDVVDVLSKLNVPGTAFSLADLLKAAGVAPSPWQGMLLYTAAFSGRYVIGLVKKYAETRKIERILKEEVGGYYNIQNLKSLSDEELKLESLNMIGSFGTLAEEVTRMQSLKASLCYASVWKNKDSDYGELCEDFKNYGLDEKDVSKYLEFLEKQKLIEKKDGKYRPTSIERLGLTYKIEKQKFRDEQLEKDVDEFLNKYPVDFV